ncbi:hypothetical protein [Actinoplanes sp. NPDC051494]|uniref:hypothetical protein n=1 Tax=Actinoplanes sp. NPDC051494 TaxID=3363907 RepID=UPI00379E9AF8
MGAIAKAKNLLTRCAPCKGTGQIPFYLQGNNPVLDRNGRQVADTQCMTFRPCPTCGGRRG